MGTIIIEKIEIKIIESYLFLSNNFKKIKIDLVLDTFDDGAIMSYLQKPFCFKKLKASPLKLSKLLRELSRINILNIVIFFLIGGKIFF